MHCLNICLASVRRIGCRGARIDRPIKTLLTMSRQVAVMAGTKLLTMEVEKSEFGHDLDLGIVGKGKSQS